MIPMPTIHIDCHKMFCMKDDYAYKNMSAEEVWDNMTEKQKKLMTDKTSIEVMEWIVDGSPHICYGCDMIYREWNKEAHKNCR